MKFNYSVLLFVIAIFAQSQSQKASSDKDCYTKMECKMNEISEKMNTDKEFIQCVKFIEDEKAMRNCVYEVIGLRDDQVNAMLNLISVYECEPSPEPQLKQCIAKCASDKSCKETCADNRNEKSIECLANQLKVTDFDAKKSVQCSKQCTQDSLSEIIDCDMRCKEPLYKKLESDDEDSMSESDNDFKSDGNKTFTTTNTSSKYSKPSDSSSTSTQQSNGFPNLSVGHVSVISAPILFALFL